MTEENIFYKDEINDDYVQSSIVMRVYPDLILKFGA